MSWITSKIHRTKKFFRKFFNFEFFATSGLFTQAFILFILSGLIIFLFSGAYHSIRKSALIFIDPPGITEVTNLHELIFGIVELILGLIFGGALISIITSALEKISYRARLGLLSYKDRDHILIIEINSKLEFILDEINNYCLTNKEKIDVVLVLSPEENIDTLREKLKKYKAIDIDFVCGELLDITTYERANINCARAIVLLEGKETSSSKNIEIVDLLLTSKEFTNRTAPFIVEIEARFFEELKEVFKDHKIHLVNKSYVLKKILNRSIVNYKYFKILSELFTFEGYEFYCVPLRELLKDKKFETIKFFDLFLGMEEGILIGVVREERRENGEKEKKALLNPGPDFEVKSEDFLIVIAENRRRIRLSNLPLGEGKKQERRLSKKLARPKLKEEKRIAIVGDFYDFPHKEIGEFLTENSLKNIQHIVEENYMDKRLWEKIRTSNFDTILLCLEDEYEYLLTLYLRAQFMGSQSEKENQSGKDFMSRIVNIILDPLYAKLLEGKKCENIIISEKLVAQYMVQCIFNPYIPQIIKEITSAEGNEFYILNKKEYPELFEMKYHDLKAFLLQNRMSYIGSFRGNKFFFNSKDIEKSSEIVVLCEGIEV